MIASVKKCKRWCIECQNFPALHSMIPSALDSCDDFSPFYGIYIPPPHTHAPALFSQHDLHLYQTRVDRPGNSSSVFRISTPPSRLGPYLISAFPPSPDPLYYRFHPINNHSDNRYTYFPTPSSRCKLPHSAICVDRTKLARRETYIPLP